MMTLVLVMVGGAVGAVGRYLVDRWLSGVTVLPLGTLVVNVAGSFLLGVLTGLGPTVPQGVTALLGVGFCGALTTWSTFAFQTLDLDSRWWAAANVTVTLLLGLGAAVLGREAVL